METVNCREANDGALYPEYCVGPGPILTILTDAFALGAAGDLPQVQAARIEAGLLWFLYASVYKKHTTAKTSRKIVTCPRLLWCRQHGGNRQWSRCIHQSFSKRHTPTSLTPCWHYAGETSTLPKWQKISYTTKSSTSSTVRSIGVALILIERIDSIATASAEDARRRAFSLFWVPPFNGRWRRLIPCHEP